MARQKIMRNNNIAEFYDDLADDFDIMASFKKRLPVEEPFFRFLVDKYGIRSALDAGCGTGFHSLLMARLGVNVTSVDVSTNMLRTLKAHARRLKYRVDARKGDFRDFDISIKIKFDALICMGNSLAHIRSARELLNTLRSFRRHLEKGGILAVQIINYDRILRLRERIISIKERGDIIFIRFYDFLQGKVRFNILKIDRSGSRPHHQLKSTLLRPVRSAELRNSLKRAGFKTIRSYGNASMDKFTPSRSTDLYIIAAK